MATFNGAEFLERQLQSILNQQLRAAEIIVCDDCSSDDTLAILQNYAAKGLLTYYVNEQRLGVICNFKKAASFASTGNYIAFSDQDDIWLPEKLQRSMQQLNSIEGNSLPCMVYSDPLVIDAADNIVHQSLWNILGADKYVHCLQTILFGNPVGGCTMLINPQLAAYIKTIPDDSYMHDAWLALCAYTFGRAAIVPQPVLKYRQHQTNVTFSTGYKQHSRVMRVLHEIRNSLNGRSDLFKVQFCLVKQFYQYFYNDIQPKERLVFERFIALENKGYIAKKLAFRKALRGLWTA